MPLADIVIHPGTDLLPTVPLGAGAVPRDVVGDGRLHE